ILLVALVIINNALLIATLDRIQEIGTMRAIGAQRRFVLTMVVMETLVLSAFAVVIGTGLARVATGLSAWKGLPSGGKDFLVLMFGGQRLFPTFDVAVAILALVVIILVALASSIYPALIATRIQPVVAMQRRE